MALSGMDCYLIYDPRTTTARLPGSFVEMQNLSPSSDLLDSNLHFNRIPGYLKICLGPHLGPTKY